MPHKGHFNYSEEERKKVVEAHNKGLTIRQISMNHDIPKSTVHNIIEGFKKYGSVKSRALENKGRPRKTKSDMESHILQMAKMDYPVSEIKSDLESRGIKLSDTSIRRRIALGNVQVKRVKPGPKKNLIRLKNHQNDSQSTVSYFALIWLIFKHFHWTNFGSIFTILYYFCTFSRPFLSFLAFRGHFRNIFSTFFTFLSPRKLPEK